MKYTKKEYETHLNELYADIIGSYFEAQEQLGYLAKRKVKTLYANKIHPDIIVAYNNQTLGSMLRKNDPIAFSVGYSDWRKNP